MYNLNSPLRILSVNEERCSTRRWAAQTRAARVAPIAVAVDGSLRADAIRIDDEGIKCFPVQTTSQFLRCSRILKQVDVTSLVPHGVGCLVPA